MISRYILVSLLHWINVKFTPVLNVGTSASVKDILSVKMNEIRYHLNDNHIIRCTCGSIQTITMIPSTLNFAVFPMNEIFLITKKR